MTTRVVVHIGHLVVHGAERFAPEAFARSLEREFARRIGEGASANDIARKLQGNASSAQHGRTTAPRRPTHNGQRSTERLVATEIAGRLLE